MTASNYEAILVENKRRYGDDVPRYGPLLITDRYADRSHFIYELLQNAEDALARRQAWNGSRAVAFRLSDTQLSVSHYGTPFTNGDVRGICGIALSMKDASSIGRFGIGFKSVFAFTDRPEVHSGDEHFVIESLVWPKAIGPVQAQPEETVFVFPFRDTDTVAREDIVSGLQRLGSRTLLFLRQIEEISWSVEGGSSGHYLRDKPKEMGKGVRRVTLVGEEQGKPVTEETWTVFAREVTTDKSEVAGHVEIAFLMTQADESGYRSIQAVSDSPLVVSFPTVVPTYLGFLVQGPYNTTPSRDNVSLNDPWNKHLVQETAKLLVEALRWLRDHDMLDTAVLGCLPLDPMQFAEDRMFGPLFEVVRHALIAEPLLPCFGGGYVAASQAKIARTLELRELLNPHQLGVLYGAGGDLRWLSGDISQDRTPDLRQYLTQVLEVDEVTPEVIVPKLDKEFLESQPDDWIVRLYEFLNGQPALLRQGRLHSLPLVRLEDGTHVEVHSYGQPEVFLPSPGETGFPTVRRAVCATEGAETFLASLGLAEADPVDDVVRNVLPKYGGEDIDVCAENYEADMHRILAAWHCDSTSQREKLLSALRETRFVRARDAGDRVLQWATPGAVYLATESLTGLFGGVAGVLLVDDTCVCLQGDDVSGLLAECGCAPYLQSVSVKAQFTYNERGDMRKDAGFPGSTGAETIEDFSLRGLEELLGSFPLLDPAVAGRKAALLWDALCDVEEESGSRVFSGTYHWFFYTQRTCEFDAAFVRQLSSTGWVPGRDGKPQLPGLVSFETTGWKRDSFLQSIVHFMPATVEPPAEVAGVELGVLDLLKELGLTTETALRAALRIKDEPDATAPNDARAAAQRLLGGAPAPTPPAPVPSGVEQPSAGRDGMDGGAGPAGPPRPHTDMAAGGQANSRTEGVGEGGGKRTPGSIGGRPFISYVGVQPDDEDSDPDGLDQRTRMALEEKAVSLITDVEPGLHRTPVDNPGYDLFEAGEEGHMVRWVEVKAMTGDLHSRPVGLSRTQFEWAREHGHAYWLYVVEHADSPNAAHIVRIQDPAGKARTFTFDHGWLSVAQLSDSTLPDEGRQP
ncbi:MAG: DUF3883 domain-containing protein [Caldiserica bacterium]|nr:DUF3883 domain-containing protein [Caldisericota bacterium]